MDVRHCQECGEKEQRLPDDRTNISPFGLCVQCHIDRAKAMKAMRTSDYDYKLAQAGEDTNG